MATQTSLYVQGHSVSSQTRHGLRTVESTCGYMVDKLRPDMHILDVGCGPGSITIGLARLVPQGKVIGIDRVGETLNRAKSQADLPGNLTFTTGDAMNLDYPEDTFDVVTTSQVVGHMQDPIHVIKQFRRVLKPGGFIALREGDHGSAVVYPESEGLRVWLDLSKRTSIASGRKLNAGRHLKAWAQAAGFEAGKTRLGMGTMVFEGPNASPNAETIMNQLRDDEVARSFAFKHQLADEATFQVIYDAFDEWRKDPACIFAMMCGELIAYK